MEHTKHLKCIGHKTMLLLDEMQLVSARLAIIFKSIPFNVFHTYIIDLMLRRSDTCDADITYLTFDIATCPLL